MFSQKENFTFNDDLNETTQELLHLMESLVNLWYTKVLQLFMLPNC